MRVGKQFVQANFVAKAADMHMIGHSLGAHISGYAGEKITGLGRISGDHSLDFSFLGRSMLKVM